ncbi:deoxynucleoside kinase [Peloplasma aerotolerans]|jgi:deoxyadenosine/deoxycytidine kinase|uniref:Deoxynucleoside kinase n=1 Tax=Peloplasma aerotolerans TaxID=3044389 RepID=A0AAW6UBW8_9MOLU|nr:deoxynucleoside kinase [Mariniplasma sp. M4Ah]MDI6453596.1 deoxynucleoside kinase [Mariniplasma sp. M4Ah]
MKISVGGMIASGKSTLVKRLGEALNLPVMEEFEKDDEVFNTLLKWLYEQKENVEMLLQIYFIHNHWLNQQKYNNHFIVDRDLVEHWLFAQHNLKNMPTIMNMYNGVFHAYMNQITKPDIYIILDVNWDNFEDRVMNRGRQQEIDNFDKNKKYFSSLLKDYTTKIAAQCSVYDIPYVIVKTSGKSEDQVFEESLAAVKKIQNN